MYMFMYSHRTLSCGNPLHVHVCTESLGCSIPLHVNVTYVNRTSSCNISLHVNVNYVHRTLSCNIPLPEHVNVNYVNRDLRCSMPLHVNVNYIHRTIVVVSKLLTQNLELWCLRGVDLWQEYSGTGLCTVGSDAWLHSTYTRSNASTG